MSQRERASRRGFTLFELLIAIAILAMISVLLFGAFSSMRKSREGLERVESRYREGRLAMQHITRELSAAYISMNVPFDTRYVVQKTSFIGRRGSATDRVDFNSFSNVRRDRDSRETDQAEISYFGERTGSDGTLDLLRRKSTRLDLDPQHGGRVDILASDIDLFELEYLDPQTGNWLDAWDSTQQTGQLNRLPLQVRVTLVLNAGARSRNEGGRGRIRLVTTIAVPIQQPLNALASQ